MTRGTWLLLILAAPLGACSGTPAPLPARRAPFDPEGGPLVPAAPPAPEKLPDEGIAARVNNEIVTWKDVADSMKKVKPEQVTPELRRSRRRLLAEERLFLQAARRNGVTVSEQQLDEVIRREVKQMGGEDAFEKYLRFNGQTRTEYREQKRRDLLVLSLYRHLFQQAWQNPTLTTPRLMLDFVSPQEILEFYKAHPEQFKAIENVTFWRIAFQFRDEKEKAEKKALAESVLRKLGEGTEFAMLTFFYSDVRRAREFEDRGKTRKELLDFYSPATVELLFDRMKEGEVSPIWEDRNTLNLFRLEQRVQQREESFEEAQPKIRTFLENKKRTENRNELRDFLKKDAYYWPPDLFDER
jgi:hypothetical protein